mmetsp:Transcript_21229/g.43330  ORF Transcript_21229/g.43330 Transcript_21229/m.43330 type:complete len:181 (-) Transcript_21229:195-737(-)
MKEELGCESDGEDDDNKQDEEEEGGGGTFEVAWVDMDRTVAKEDEGEASCDTKANDVLAEEPPKFSLFLHRRMTGMPDANDIFTGCPPQFIPARCSSSQEVTEGSEFHREKSASCKMLRKDDEEDDGELLQGDADDVDVDDDDDALDEAGTDATTRPGKTAPSDGRNCGKTVAKNEVAKA